MTRLTPFTKPQDIFRHEVGIMLGSWESTVCSHFAMCLLYRLVVVARTFYMSITYQMEIKNNCFTLYIA